MVDAETKKWRSEALDFFVGEPKLDYHIDKLKFHVALKNAKKRSNNNFKLCYFDAESSAQCFYTKPRKQDNNFRTILTGLNPTKDKIMFSIHTLKKEDFLVLMYDHAHNRDDIESQITALEETGKFDFLEKGSSCGKLNRIIHSKADLISKTPLILQIFILPILKGIISLDVIFCKAFIKSGTHYFFIYRKSK
jgi:hypothetical protein